MIEVNNFKLRVLEFQSGNKKMGNAVSFIKGHGKRLLNRYNAQYRAFKFLDREKLAKAPRHKLPLEYRDVIGSSSVFDFQKKDLELDEHLKNVYVHSKDKIPENSPKSNFKNPLRPLPESREPMENYFMEPVDVMKGFCTLSQVSQFLASHEDDPENNTPAAIAKSYNLDIDKVENVLKYHCIFKSNEYTIRTHPLEDTDNKETVKDLIDKISDQEQSVIDYYKIASKGAKGIEEKKLEQEKGEDKNDELNRKAVSSK